MKDKLIEVLGHPVTEIAIRTTVGTLFTVKAVRHFRKGNYVRGALLGVTGVSNLVKSVKCVVALKKGK